MRGLTKGLKNAALPIHTKYINGSSMRHIEYEEALTWYDYYLNLETTWIIIWVIIIMLVVSTIRRRI